MNDKELIGPKCGKTMEEGFIVDCIYGGAVQSRWMKGKPQKSFWTKIKIRKSELVPIATYRCIACGYLESYVSSPPL